MSKILFEQESFLIRGACYEVHNEKGPGFKEPVYQECLEIEMGLQGIPFVSEPTLSLSYKGVPLSQTYKPDIVCYEKIILELKAVEALNAKHRSQVHNYLAATGLKLGFLINFAAHPKLEIVRIVC